MIGDERPEMRVRKEIRVKGTVFLCIYDDDSVMVFDKDEVDGRGAIDLTEAQARALSTVLHNWKSGNL